MLYAYDQRFDVTENLENFYELNQASRKRSRCHHHYTRPGRLDGLKVMKTG